MSSPFGGGGGGGHKNQLSIVFLCLPIFALRSSGRVFFVLLLIKGSFIDSSFSCRTSSLIS